MKSKFLTVAAILGCAIASPADTLLWCVNSSETFDYAILNYKASDGTGGTVMATVDNGQTASAYSSTWAAGEEAAIAYVDSGFSGYSFSVSLMSGGSAIATSGDYDYSALSQYISKDVNVPTGGDVWTVDFTAVPEPSSALLLLLGGAALALRRRRTAPGSVA